LRAAVDLKALGARTLWLDCDVLQADGGTRTASITGASVAASIALNKLMAEGKLKAFPMKSLVAAVSCGVYQDEVVLDLNYPEDRDASVDSNLVMTESLALVEMQMSGEEATFTEEQMAKMVTYGKKGIAEIVAKQKEAILAADKPDGNSLSDLAAAFGPK